MKWTGSVYRIGNPIQSKWIWTGLDYEITFNGFWIGLDWKFVISLFHIGRQIIIVIKHITFWKTSDSKAYRYIHEGS